MPEAVLEEPPAKVSVSPGVDEKRAAYQGKIAPEGEADDEETKEKNRLLRAKTLVMGEEIFTESDADEAC